MLDKVKIIKKIKFKCLNPITVIQMTNGNTIEIETVRLSMNMFGNGKSLLYEPNTNSTLYST